MNYYNEWDKDAATWLRELIKAGLIPSGDVDERSITEVKAHELTEYTQCHFFAGIGGWPVAFQLAEVADTENVDTGSCPCQPFSGTGKQMGFADPRHLWPAFRRVIGKRRPAKIYGEQVASKLGREWLARVFSDLAFMGYAGSGADLCSAGVGSPNIRQRLYWVGGAHFERSAANGMAESDRGKRDGQPDGEGGQRNGASPGRKQGNGEPESCGNAVGVAVAGHQCGGGCDSRTEGKTQTAGQDNNNAPFRSGPTVRLEQPAFVRFGARVGESVGADENRPDTNRPSPTHRLGDSYCPRPQGRVFRWNGGNERAAGPTGLGMWGDCEVVYCRDEKFRRIESGSFPLANGIPSRVGPLLTELRKLGRSSIAFARANRNIRLKGYGNAINPWVAAKFITATST